MAVEENHRFLYDRTVRNYGCLQTNVCVYNDVLSVECEFRESRQHTPALSFELQSNGQVHNPSIAESIGLTLLPVLINSEFLLCGIFNVFVTYSSFLRYAFCIITLCIENIASLDLMQPFSFNLNFTVFFRLKSFQCRLADSIQTRNKSDNFKKWSIGWNLSWVNDQLVLNLVGLVMELYDFFPKIQQYIKWWWDSSHFLLF